MRVTTWLTQQGVMPGASDISGIARQALGSVGRLTSWVGTAVGALTTMFMIMVIGLFVAMEPARLRTRAAMAGAAGATATNSRSRCGAMGHTLRRLLAGRLLGMVAEGVLTWLRADDRRACRWR